jgi:hypothetical protein
VAIKICSMFLLYMAVSGCFALASEPTCNEDIFEVFKQYRLTVNKEINATSVRSFIYTDSFFQQAKLELEDETYFDFLISDDDVNKHADNNIQRLNRVVRDIVGVEGYVSVCNDSDSRGELFLKSIDVSTEIERVSFAFKKLDSEWRLENIQLINYSSILKSNFSDFIDKMVPVFIRFPDQAVLDCLEQLNETFVGSKNQEPYANKVDECYTQNKY